MVCYSQILFQRGQRRIYFGPPMGNFFNPTFAIELSRPVSPDMLVTVCFLRLPTGLLTGPWYFKHYRLKSSIYIEVYDLFLSGSYFRQEKYKKQKLYLVDGEKWR